MYSAKQNKLSENKLIQDVYPMIVQSKGDMSKVKVTRSYYVKIGLVA